MELLPTTQTTQTRELSDSFCFEKMLELPVIDIRKVILSSAS